MKSPRFPPEPGLGNGLAGGVGGAGSCCATARFVDATADMNTINALSGDHTNLHNLMALHLWGFSGSRHGHELPSYWLSPRSRYGCVLILMAMKFSAGSSRTPITSENRLHRSPAPDDFTSTARHIGSDLQRSAHASGSLA